MRNLIHIFIPCQLDENLAKTTLEYPNLKKYLREKKNKIDYKILVKHNKGSKLSEVVIHKACYGSSESQWWHKHRFLVPLIEYMWYVRQILIPIKGFHIRRWWLIISYQFLKLLPKTNHLIKWVSDCCLMPSEQFFRHYIMAMTSYIQWNDDADVRMY
jgi:hypothetical protein